MTWRSTTTRSFRRSSKQNSVKDTRTSLSAALKGAYAVCKVVYDRATDETKTPDERLNIIKEFCATLAKGKEPGDTDKPDKSA